MSILLNISVLKSHEITKTQGEKPKSSSILLSMGIILGILLVMYDGISYTEDVMKQYSACRDKIIAY